MVTDLIELRLNSVVVSDSLCSCISNLVGYLASLDEGVNTLLDCLGALSNLTDEVDVAVGEFQCLFLTEDVDHALYVLCQLALIVGGNRNDMVHREVAEDTCLNLNLLSVGFPFHLVTSFKLMTVHDFL